MSASQRAVLAEYAEDVDHLLNDLRGPARDFAEQLGVLVETVLDAAATNAGVGRARSAPGSYAA